MSGNEAPKRPLLGYKTLRQITEWASGVRGGAPTWFVLKPGPVPDDPLIETWLTDPHESLSRDELEGVVVIPTHVGHGSGNRQTIQYARIGPWRDGEESVDVIDPTGLQGDSVFWSLSAVEKFLVPYYASVSGSLAAQRVEAVLKLLGSPREMAAGDPPVVYALVHLPQSEYTDPRADARHRARAMGFPLDLAVAYRHGDESRVVHIVEFFDRFSDVLEPPTAPGRAGRGAGTA